MTERERKAFSLRNTLSHAKSDMRPQTASDERARGDLPHKSLCAAMDNATIPDTSLIFPHINYRYSAKQGKRNYLKRVLLQATPHKSCGAAGGFTTTFSYCESYHSSTINYLFGEI